MRALQQSSGCFDGESIRPRRVRHRRLSVPPVVSASNRAALPDVSDHHWFVVIGAQRSRSTFLYESIRRHPGVFSPKREVSYFEDPVWGRQSPTAFNRLFAGATNGQVRGFKRPELFGRTECPSRLAASLPQAKLIAVLREPISRAISAYFHYVRTNFLPDRPLNAGMRAILDGKYRRYPHAQEVLEFGLYGRHIRTYRQNFKPSQLLIIFEQDLDEDSGGTLTNVFRHIGVPSSLPAQAPRTATNAGVYASGYRMRLLRIGSRALYTLDPKTQLRTGEPAFARRLANRLTADVDRLVLARVSPVRPPTLDDDVFDALHSYFAPDVRQLEQLLERRLPSWPMRRGAV